MTTEWTNWNGGECPIPGAKAGEYEVKILNPIGISKLNPDCDAEECAWSNQTDKFSTIIAYRLIEKEQSDLDWLEVKVTELHEEIRKEPEYTIYPPCYRVLNLIKQRREAKS